MDEDIAIINTNTRNEKIKNFFIKNKKILIILVSIIILLIFGYFIYKEIDQSNKSKLAEKYNTSVINYISGNKINVENEMVTIIESKNKTYSPLALYFLIDNNVINSSNKINRLFDILINETKLDKEIKNLIIYKKGLYNSEFETENNLLEILKPIINSESIWKSHALYLLGEYFYSKNEKQKAKEFFQKIIILENNNPKIKLEAQKRIQRDLSG
jgi:predicted negative regulator of RcsB-dependent stress response